MCKVHAVDTQKNRLNEIALQVSPMARFNRVIKHDFLKLKYAVTSAETQGLYCSLGMIGESLNSHKVPNIC